MEVEERSLEMLFRVLRASRWAGVAPYRSLRPPRVSRTYDFYGKTFSICYCAMIMITAILNLWYQACNLSTLTEQVSLWLRVCAETMCNAGIAFIGMFRAPGRMNNTFGYLNSLKQICRSIKSVLSDDHRQKKVGAFFMGVQIMIIVFNFIDIWVGILEMEVKVHLAYYIYTSTVLSLQYFVTNMVMLQFVMVALTINLSFRTINDQLEEILNKEQSLGSIGTDQLAHRKVRSLANAYVMTCSVVRQHSNANKVLLMLLVFNILTNLINSACYAVIQINRGIEIAAIAYEIMYYMLHVSRFMLLVAPTEAINAEIELTHMLIRKLMHTVRSRWSPLLPELQTFLLHLTLNEPAYEPMGIYTLRRSLVLAVIAVCTTYVMIFQEF